MAAKRAKLKFRPTPISRLFKYKSPIPMVGDPPWRRGNWSDRARVLYAEALAIKRGGWTDATWIIAHNENHRLDELISRKWDDYELAWQDAKWLDHDQAHMDNATWDYEHDNYVGATLAA